MASVIHNPMANFDFLPSPSTGAVVYANGVDAVLSVRLIITMLTISITKSSKDSSMKCGQYNEN